MLGSLVHPAEQSGRLNDVIANKSDRRNISAGGASKFNPRAKMTDVTREEIDAKLGRSKAEAESGAARLDGKLDLVLAKLDAFKSDVGLRFGEMEGRFDEMKAYNVETRSVSRDDQRSMRNNLWAVGLGLAAIIVAMAVAFPTFFGMGAQVKDVATLAAREQVQQSLKVSPDAAPSPTGDAVGKVMPPPGTVPAPTGQAKGTVTPPKK